MNMRTALLVTSALLVWGCTQTHQPTADTVAPSTTTTVPPEPPDLHALIAGAPDQEAELSLLGDLLHTTTDGGETFDAIALWYTLETENGPRLARINGHGTSEGPLSGERIVVPRYLVKNRKRLAAALVSPLLALMTASAPDDTE
jgi:hypothetical protein